MRTYQQTPNEITKRKVKQNQILKQNKKQKILKLKSIGLISFIVSLTKFFTFLGVNHKNKSSHQWWEMYLISILDKTDDPKTTQRWPQNMIMESKQAINKLHFLIIIFTLCHSYDQKTGSAFTSYLMWGRLNLGHPNWSAWSLGVENSLYQPLIFEFLFNNIKQ